MKCNWFKSVLQCVCGQWWIQYRCVPCQLLICTAWHFTLFFPLYLSSVDLLYIAVLSTQNVEHLCTNACLKLQFRGTGSLWLLWHLSFSSNAWHVISYIQEWIALEKDEVSLREHREISLCSQAKRSFHENCHKHFEMSMRTWGVLQLPHL